MCPITFPLCMPLYVYLFLVFIGMSNIYAGIEVSILFTGLVGIYLYRKYIKPRLSKPK